MFGELEEEKEKMIKIARKCFETANNVTFTNFNLDLFIYYFLILIMLLHIIRFGNTLIVIPRMNAGCIIMCSGK